MDWLNVVVSFREAVEINDLLLYSRIRYHAMREAALLRQDDDLDHGLILFLPS